MIKILTENINDNYKIDEKRFITVGKRVLEYYLSKIKNLSCLNNYEYKKITFDVLYCDSIKTHEINREYRNKDYPADIITFAIFADSEEKFILDGEINLGEIIIALDKVDEESKKKGTTYEHELSFLISHGIMHLLGFDHQTEEEYNFIVNEQEQALSKVKGL